MRGVGAPGGRGATPRTRRRNWGTGCAVTRASTLCTPATEGDAFPHHEPHATVGSTASERGAASHARPALRQSLTPCRRGWWGRTSSAAGSEMRPIMVGPTFRNWPSFTPPKVFASIFQNPSSCSSAQRQPQAPARGVRLARQAECAVGRAQLLRGCAGRVPHPLRA
jgi:hypothetical protein